MKKYLFTCAGAIALIALLALTASAQVPETVLQVTTVAGEAVLNFFSLVLNGLNVLASYYYALFAWLPALSGWAFLPIVVLLAALCLFGYRMYRPISLACGAAFGFALGYALYDLLLAWVAAPAWVSLFASILQWVAAGVGALLGLLFAFFLRRLGISVLFALAVTVFMSSYTENIFLLIAVLIGSFALALLVIKTLLIYVTGIGGSICLLRILFGTNGRFPFDLNTFFGITGIDAWLICGLLLGCMCVAFQWRMFRSRRYY